MKDCKNLNQLCKKHLEVLKEVVGSKGTLLVPTYSYSFGETSALELASYNKERTESKIGAFPNYVIKEKDFRRTKDPMVSVAVWGEKSKKLTLDLPNSSYGIDSIFERLLDVEAKCVSIGLGVNWTPFIHYLDYIKRAEYRYDKIFIGKIIEDSISNTMIWNYAVSKKLANGTGDCRKLGELGRLHNIWRVIKVGKSIICCSDYKEYFEFASDQWSKHIWLTTNNNNDIVHEKRSQGKQMKRWIRT